MIQGLYETHIQVSNLEKAVQFYTEVLGLELAHYDDNRPIAFLWIGENKKAMLGLWEQQENLQKRHFAFSCSKDFILNSANKFLEDNGLKAYNFLKNGDNKPMVFAWMPALALYFDDPDGNQLEFIHILEGTSQPALGVISYADWLQRKDDSKV
ncbi:VOC family protein [Chitinophaga silvatica]|uniref:VOC family protein n=1 Tax=Chitinophaga silvatica TaxID=2282649 RepID=A0A3E1YG39_9BACT|nr:VOC family protein [Chitinophaga silvatica]RFS26375.1 VOC family protein [Chitinophaga silvatica]